MSLQDEWDTLPFSTQMRLPITAAIPYFYRWKINQLKLLLNDIQYLAEKHHIKGAILLRSVATLEAEALCDALTAEILRTRTERQKLAETKTPTQKWEKAAHKAAEELAKKTERKWKSGKGKIKGLQKYGEAQT